jgi:hypothetical protein
MCVGLPVREGGNMQWCRVSALGSFCSAGDCSGVNRPQEGLACRVEEIRDQDIGTKAGLFEVLKIGDEFYSFIVDCKDPKACTILLRGASKDVLNEVCHNVLPLSVIPSAYWLSELNFLSPSG